MKPSSGLMNLKSVLAALRTQGAYPSRRAGSYAVSWFLDADGWAIRYAAKLLAVRDQPVIEGEANERG
jgi:hypothetical protein